MRARSAALCLLGLLTCGCEPSAQTPAGKTLEQVSVRLPIPIIEGQQAPYYLAQDRGLFAAEGLDASMHMGSTEMNPVKAVTSGRDTFGVLGGPDTLLVAISRGAPLVALGVFHTDSNFPCLVVHKDSPYHKPQDLDGKRVGFFYGHISTDVLRSMFKRTGTTVKEVSVGFDHSRFINRQLDAIWQWRVIAEVDWQLKGLDVRVINPGDFGVHVHGYTLFTRRDTLQKKPHMVTAFMRGLLRGYQATERDLEPALQNYIVDRNPGAKLAFETQRFLGHAKYFSRPFGKMNEAMFSDTYARLLGLGVIEKPFNVRTAFNATPWQDAVTILNSRGSL